MKARLVLAAAVALAACDARTITYATPPPTPAASVATATPTAIPSTPTPRPATPSPAPTPPASATQTRTPAPTLPPSVSLPPLPAQPPLRDGARVVASGSVLFSLAPGERRTFTAQDVAGTVTPVPSCPSLAWTVAWRSTGALTAAWFSGGHGVRVDVGRGRWGTFDLGCAPFELWNDGATAVQGEVAYTIGSR